MKHLTASLPAAVWLSALTPSPLPAETELPMIVISASRSEQESLQTPAGISIITREEIEQGAAQNLLQLLNGRSGIQVNSLFGDGSNATLDMRGFGANAGANTLVLVDGRRLNNAGDSAAPDLNSIDLRRVERIEVVQGSAGVLFGNQAVGGMVNIITREAQDFAANLSATAGSYNGYELYADISDRLDNGLAYRFSANHKESDNYRDNNDSDRRDFNLRIDYSHKNGGLFFEQQWIDDYQQQPGALFKEELEADRRQSAAAYAGDFSDTESTVSRLGIQHYLGLYWSFAGELTYRENERRFQSGFRTFPGSPATQDREVMGLNPRFTGILPLSSGEATLTAGADLERTDYALRTSFGPQLLDQSVDALYLQLTAPMTTRTSVTAGLRHARIDNQIDTDTSTDRVDDSVNVASLGVTIRPSEALRLFARIDQNYRFATVDEHTNVVSGQPVGIDNQTGVSYETGIEWSRPGLRSKLVIYRLDLDKEISFDASGFVNTNLEETRRKGVIAEARWQAGQAITLGGSFAYTDPTITDGPFEGSRIPLVASRSAQLNGDWRLSPNWSLFAEGVFSRERVVGGDFNNDLARLAGYGVLNAGLHYRSGPWRLSLRVDNLLDKQYANAGAAGFDQSFSQRAAYFPAPERHFRLTLDYRIE
ncbi:MAG: TonB-dependent receptor [Candidatus Thiodiazotropha sp. (ex Epidulcina cf. delphinae)]|nr:TonB-dependent receptor [Candidatus Thiodiazotropha sp. (ex Epidulcina cf. delphinae)]